MGIAFDSIEAFLKRFLRDYIMYYYIALKARQPVELGSKSLRVYR
jgi:hypothetical protein